MSELQVGTIVKFNPFYEHNRESGFANAERFKGELEVYRLRPADDYFDVRLKNDRCYRRKELLIKGVDYE